MPSVLITGASGFIGRFVTAEMISRGYTVHAPYLSQPLPEQKNLIQTQLDLSDPQAVAAYIKKLRPENLIHLAWYTGPKCHIHACNLDWLKWSLHLLGCFAENGGKKFLGAGSVSEYDFSYGVLQEDRTPLTNPVLYGQAKAALYNTGKAFCAGNNIEFKWARIFNLYGPGERPTRLMPSVICAMLKNEPVQVSPCTKFLDYLHVEDTARGIAQLFESPVTGAVNISSGAPIQLRYIVEEIARQTGFKGEILWGALKENFADPIIAGSNARLTQEVKWTPKYTLQSGLAQTINWWREHYREHI